MMRAFAVLGAAAVVLFALPSTAGAAADLSASATDAAVDTSVGAASFLARSSILGLSMGAVLWLSVAVVALTFALVALNRSRERGAEPASPPFASDFAAADLGFDGMLQAGG